ncbi:hypothetical protein C5167_010639, partial [Papaver somniferum]
LFSDHLESTKETIGVEEKEDEVVLDVVQCSSEEPINVVGFDSTEYFTTNKTFSSKENVTEWCREIGSQYNIVVVIKKGVNKNENHGGKGSAIVLGCERGGKYRKRNCTVSPSKCRKGTATKKCRCPFKLRSTCVDASKWNLIVKDGHHNHAPTDTLLGHSFPGRLSDEEKQFVIKFHEYGMLPRQILIALRENFKKNASTLKTIGNCIQKHRVSERAGRTRMQLLHKYLDDSHYVTWNRQNSDTCEVTDIFWAHPESTLCAQCFPSQYSLDFIISEIKRLEKSRSIAESLCGCILHKTHGLPCAHMISEYRNQGKPIPLSFIDSQWRQINLVPHVSRSNAVYDYLPQLEILRRKWENSTDPEKSRINELVTVFVTKIVQPDKNNFQEPPAPVRTKGRKTIAEKKKESKKILVIEIFLGMNMVIHKKRYLQYYMRAPKLKNNQERLKKPTVPNKKENIQKKILNIGGKEDKNRNFRGYV